MKVELTEQQLNNLRVFLNRVELKGDEAIAYVDLLATIEQAMNLNIQDIDKKEDK